MGENGLRGGIRHGEHDGGIQNEVSGLKPEVVVEVKIRVIFVDVDRSAPYMAMMSLMFYCVMYNSTGYRVRVEKSYK